MNWTSYDALGPVYDQDAHIEPAIGFYKSIRAQLTGLRGEVVLDLGCGTGLLSERLAARGCHVIGIDKARRMLAVAKDRCDRFGNRVRFVQSQLGDFRTSGLASAAFASGDVTNHLLTEKALGKFFKNVVRHIRDDGIFVFDTLNQWCFEKYWRDQTYFFEGRHGDIVMECAWHAESRIGTADMTVYERNGASFVRRKYLLRECFFRDAQVRRLLKTAGFASIKSKSWSPWPDQDQEESNDRTLWVAGKKQER